MKVLFLGGPVPDDSDFCCQGFSRSGNLAARGIADGLFKAMGADLTVISYQSIRAFPGTRQLRLRGGKLTFPSGLVSYLMPGINFPYIRGFLRGIFTFFSILHWVSKNRGEKRYIVSFNFRTPPFCAVLAGARLTHSKMIPIVMDIGMPPGQTNPLKNALDWIENKLVKVLAPAFDGVAVITEAMGVRYFPKNRRMLLDGGLSPDVQNRLFPLGRDVETECDTVTFVMAGSLGRMNGVDLVLDAMKINDNPRIRLVMAGADSTGKLSDRIKKDSRIKFVGMLKLDALFRLYQQADVLMNIRLTKSMDSSLWFPSKSLEALACGRLLLSTSVAHLKQTYGAYCSILEDETPEALSEKMNELVALPRKVRDGIGAKARAYMLNEHTWNHQMKRFLEFCNE